MERFLANVPAGSGLAFVIIQHQDPNYKGMLPELLQRTTSMPVVQAASQMAVEPNCVYVIPPNKDLSILHGVLFLLDTVAPRGLHLPIDFFFRILAEDQLERAVGVILSGMGSDGTLGLRAIRENAGLTLVQEPGSAKFDSMPRSAIDAGLADIVALVEEMPGKIIDYLQHAGPITAPKLGLDKKSVSALNNVMILLRQRSGNDFSLYKKNTLLRRTERRMGIHQIGSLPAYVRYLRENHQELDLLFKEMLIGVTSFFRDPEVWAYLKKEVLPALLASYPDGKAFRAWVVACSTGEEAYSLAILFKEVLAEVNPQARFSLQIFATDLDRDAIDKARQGVYPANIAADVSALRLDRYFVSEQNTLRVSKEIREMVTFAVQNVLTNPPFSKLDFLSCRNLLIYLHAESQDKLLRVFHYALNPSGILLLGSAETVGASALLFAALDRDTRVFRHTGEPATVVEFPISVPASETHVLRDRKAFRSTDNLQSQADQFLRQTFAPAAVLVNPDGDILYVSGRTGRYLEPAAGKANWNIHAMAREGLRYEVAAALKQVAHQRGAITLHGLQIGASDGGEHRVNIVVQAIEQPETLQGMIMIVFTDVPSSPKKKGRVLSLKAEGLAELEQARANNQAMREQMQTTHEELTSTNEELQSSNEELQSANEELTTSKEEMQSLNEELQTVNAELQSKVEEYLTVSNDMKNLLNSTDIAMVFLDQELKIRRFTTHANRPFKLIAGDVGRPLSDIVTDLVYPQLQEDAQEVLRSLVFSEKQIRTHDERWFKVRILPYRSFANMIDGVVLTFSDISKSKALEQELREAIQGGR